MTKKIEEMYAFVVTDPDDDTEGVIGMKTDIGWMPLVGADLSRIESLREMAKTIAGAAGTRDSLKLLRFSHRTEEEV